jgi:AcrR family transcriptional regulator
MKSNGNLTKKKIVHESFLLFSRKGYFNTSVNDILLATGLTKGGLYSHFSSKEAIWHAVYEEASKIWRSVVFEGVRKIDDPIERIDRVISNVMKNYTGGTVFDGGGFFVPMLVELSGQSSRMSQQIMQGFDSFSELLCSWLKEADQRGLLRKNINHKEIANFILISLNGTTTLYVATKNKTIWEQTVNQLRFFVRQLGNR